MIDYFSNFVIVKVHKLPQLVFSTSTRTKVIVYVISKIFNIYRSLAPFPAHKCAKWQGQPKPKIFRSPCSFCIFWRRLWIRIIRRIRYTIIPVQWKRFFHFIAHITHLLCCWVFGISSKMSQSVLNLYQHVLLKPAKIYHLHTGSICC